MDRESVLRSLNEHDVEFVVIGAAAFPIHGYARATLDIDVLIRASEENATRTLAALRHAGYDVDDLTVGDLQETKVLIRQYIVELDVHPFVAGTNFDRVWASRIPGKFGKEDVFYASLDELIAMKRAANRPKDLEDLRVLERLART